MRTWGDPVVVGSQDLPAMPPALPAARISRGARTVVGAAIANGETKWNVSGLNEGEANVSQVGGYASTRWNSFYASARRGRVASRRDRTHVGPDPPVSGGINQIARSLTSAHLI